MTWLYVVGILGALLLLLLLLRVRLRVIYSPDLRTAGLTLGRRTGFEADFLSFRGTVRVAGIPVYRMDLHRKSRAAEEETTREGTEKVTIEAAGKPTRPLGERVAVVRENLPQAWRAAKDYLRSLYRATRVEELSARIEAGFSSPDETGKALGYYNAALGTAPKLVSHVQFVPVWLGPSFAGSGRLTLAIPLYRLLWSTIVLLWRFPSRKLIKGLR